MRKVQRILIILIVLILIIVLTLGAYVYLATDLLKTNKQLFFKYVAQVADEEVSFLDESLLKFFDKKGTEIYSNNGSFYVEYSTDETQKEAENLVNKMDISFNGQINNQALEMIQNISINYSNDVKTDFMLQRIDDIWAIKSEDLSRKFIGTEANKTSSSSSSILDGGLSANSLQEALGEINRINNTKVDEQEIKQLYNKCLQIVNDELQDESFTKIDAGNDMGYKLTITGEQFKTIAIKILEEIKQNAVFLSSINLNVNDIQEEIDSLNEKNDLSGKVLNFTVYQSANVLKRIEFEEDSSKVSITHAKINDKITYVISASYKQNDYEFSIELNADYTGLNAMQSVNEKYELDLSVSTDDNKAVFKYFLNDNVIFGESMQIEEFTNDNLLNISKLDDSQAEKVREALVNRIKLINNNNLEKLGISEELNPLLNMIKIPVEYVGSLLIYSSAMDIVSSSEDTDEILAKEFNSKFEQYEGKNVSGSTVNALLKSVLLNNLTHEIDGKQISVTGDVILNPEDEAITDYPDNLATYTVEIKYDFDGYVKIINVKQN